MASGSTDVARLIVSSLFPTSNPNGETYIAHVQTFEEVPGAARKPRYLILAAARDGRLKLHKSKQNTNMTFSIGKTWAVEELRSIEVTKRMVDGVNSPQPLDFTLIINGKTYKYETEMPSSQQASFLVSMVRHWRKYMIGKSTVDLILVGFSVDNAGARSSIISNASSQTRPNQLPPSSSASSFRDNGRHSPTNRQETQQQNLQSHLQQQQQQQQQRRPSAAVSNKTTHSTYSIESPAPSVSLGLQQQRASIPVIPGISTAGSFRSQSPANAQPVNRVGSNTNLSSNTNRNGMIKPPTAYPLDVDVTRSIINSASISAAPSTRRPSIPKIPLISTTNLPPSIPSNSSLAHLNNNLSTPLSAGGASLSSPGGSTRRGMDELLDDETVLSNVEEMLEGFEWSSGGGGSASGGGNGAWGSSSGARRRNGKADEIEKRLVGELKALEAASIHAIMESDDRVTFVISHLDDALAELEKMDSMIGMYKSQLSLLTDDIAHIEGQNRGLQVQTSNQRMLVTELDNLMNTIHIPDADLSALTQESLENPRGIERLERAAVSLYKALLSTRDTPVGEMAAASERVDEYKNKASQFCKRLFDFLAIMFKFQVDQLLNPREPQRDNLKLPSHSTMEDFLGRYCGLMLFVKEIDYGKYQQICAAYFTAMSGLHRGEIQRLMGNYRLNIRKATEEELDANFSSVKESPTMRQQSIRRAGTLIRSPMEGGKRELNDGKICGSEAFAMAMSQVVPHVLREQGFISDFLHINGLDTSITFADYMTLETYFKRGATRYLVSQQGKMKDIRSAMELVFGFLETELKDWIDAVLIKDSMQIIGILAALDNSILKAEEERNDFLTRALQKQYQKFLTALERSSKDQIKSIEQTKLTLKKRKGVVPFVRIFPLFVNRVESQLEGADDLRIRDVINTNYERIVSTMFDSLQQMAKMDREGAPGEDNKGQLNYYVIIIENMHHIVTVVTKQNVPALDNFVSQARDMYNDNLDLYIKLVLRRPLAKLLDFFQGLEQLLRSTPPTEVNLHSAYTRAALKRATTDSRSKDLRKAIDVLYKRVDKHFGDVLNPSAEHADVIKTVWKACEVEVLRLEAAWRGLIEKCYPDEKTGLGFTKEEVHGFFVSAQN